jgi:hypothetical protein
MKRSRLKKGSSRFRPARLSREVAMVDGFKRITYDVTGMTDSQKGDVVMEMKKEGFERFSVGYEGKRKFFIYWKKG